MKSTSSQRTPLLLLTITLMSVIGLIACDIFLPALPDIIRITLGRAMVSDFF